MFVARYQKYLHYNAYNIILFGIFQIIIRPGENMLQYYIEIVPIYII